MTPSELSYLPFLPVEIKSLREDRVIEMRVVDSADHLPRWGARTSYLVRWQQGEGIKVLKEARYPVPKYAALRALQTVLTQQLNNRKVSGPLYKLMLDKIRTELAPAYMPDAADPLWRYMWNYSYVNWTVGYYADYSVQLIEASGHGGIRMSARRRTSSKPFVVRWSEDSGFDFTDEVGSVFKPNQNELRGMQLSLVKSMLAGGSRDPLALDLLDKLWSATEGRLPLRY